MKDVILLVQISPLIYSKLANKISKDDLNWSESVLFVKKQKTSKEATLRLGLMYSQRECISFSVPIIAY